MFQAQQSVINLSHNMRVFSWICLRQVFVKRNSCNPWYGSDKMIFSLYGRMERKNLKIFWKVLMNLIPALNLPMNPIKKVRVSWYKSKFKKQQVFLPTGTLNLLTVINIYVTCLLINTTLKNQLPLASLCELVGYAIQRRILKIRKKKWNRGSGKGSTQRTWLMLKWVKLSFST